jgi:hypothetical protein
VSSVASRRPNVARKRRVTSTKRRAQASTRVGSLAGEQLSGRISVGLGVCAFLKGDGFANPGNGGVAEWSKAAVLKTAVSKGTRGSNPFASANKPPETRGVWCFWGEKASVAAASERRGV